MTKKDFSLFSDAKIQFEVSQLQMKLLRATMSFFINYFTKHPIARLSKVEFYKLTKDAIKKFHELFIHSLN